MFLPCIDKSDDDDDDYVIFNSGLNPRWWSR